MISWNIYPCPHVNSQIKNIQRNYTAKIDELSKCLLDDGTDTYGTLIPIRMVQRHLVQMIHIIADTYHWTCKFGKQTNFDEWPICGWDCRGGQLKRQVLDDKETPERRYICGTLRSYTFSNILWNGRTSNGTFLSTKISTTNTSKMQGATCIASRIHKKSS